MPTFTGTDQTDYIVAGYISPGVTADPTGSLPGAGADVIFGNGNADYLSGGAGADSVNGGTGLDSLFGDIGSDTLEGGDGSDQLLGGAGNDQLYGDADDDTLDGGQGADTMYGGEGVDIYYVDNVGDVIAGSTYDASLDVVYSSVSFTLAPGFGFLTLTGTADINGRGSEGYNYIAGNSGDNKLFGMSFQDGLVGGAGDDTLDGGGSYDYLEGDDGNDLLLGGAGGDDLYGGAGADTLAGGSGDDRYYVDAEDVVFEESNDGIDTVYTEIAWTLGNNVENLRLEAVATVRGNSLDNLMDANGYDGTIYTLTGDDTLISGIGVSTLVGGTGDDLYYVKSGGAKIIENVGGGSDTANVKFWYGSDQYILDDHVEILDIADYYYYNYYDESGYFVASTVTGNAVANTINGGYADNTIRGLGGGDTLRGGEGNDILDGGAGRDDLDGGEGNDTVLYTSNTTPVRVDLIAGTVSFPGQNWASETVVSIESASTGSGADTLIGSSGANELHGMASADRLEGGGGADRLVGGAGNDVFVFTASTSTPSVRDTIAAGDGAAAFQGAGAAAGDRIDVSGLDADSTMGGVQGWVFGTSHARGHLWVTTSGTQTILNGNSDNDAAIEFQVAIADAGVAASAYTADDFIL